MMVSKTGFIEEKKTYEKRRSVKNEPPKNERMGSEERNSVSGSKPESPQCRTKQQVTGLVL